MHTKASGSSLVENVGSKRIVQSRTRQGIFLLFRDPFALSAGVLATQVGKGEKTVETTRHARLDHPPKANEGDAGKSGTRAGYFICPCAEGFRNRSIFLSRSGLKKTIHPVRTGNRKNRYPLLSPWGRLYIFQPAKVKTFTRFRRIPGRRGERVLPGFSDRPVRWRPRTPPRKAPP